MKLSVLRRSLIVRLVGMSLLLLLIVQAAGFAVVRATIDRNARSQISPATIFTSRPGSASPTSAAPSASLAHTVEANSVRP